MPAYVEQCANAYAERSTGYSRSCDYPGAAPAALVAERLGLPGAPPRAVLRAAHKYDARCVQREVVPEATPRFASLDPLAAPLRQLPTGFPCFVKPVKGLFSLWARRVEDPDALARLCANPALREFLARWTRSFEDPLAPYPEFTLGSRALLAEELLHGALVTVEGFRQGARLEILGVVDSGVHPVTRSFTRFDFPSRLPPAVQARMADVAARLIPALGLDATFFNVEMFWDAEADRIAIVEVNPRMVGQFADLYARALGGSSYPDAMRLATGTAPRARPAHACGCAASIPLRTFEPVSVRKAPTPERLRALEREYPGAPLLWGECRTGDLLRDFDAEDGASLRYAILNLGAADRVQLDARLVELEAALGSTSSTPCPRPDARAPAPRSRPAAARRCRTPARGA